MDVLNLRRWVAPAAGAAVLTLTAAGSAQAVTPKPITAAA